MIETILLIAAAASQVPPPIVSVLPPSKAPAASAFEPVIARFRPGQAICGGAAATPIFVEEPVPAGMMQLKGAAPIHPGGEKISFAFAIDARGRPLDIRQTDSLAATRALDTRDVAPALAAWRFQPGAQLQACRITFDVETHPVSAAPLDTLYAYLALQRPKVPGFNQAVGTAAVERARPAGSNCFGPRFNSVREQHHPAVEEIAIAPGEFAYSFLAFDIAADGRARNVRVMGSDGNAALNSAAAEAVSKWRFSPGERTGCVHSYGPPGREILAAATPPPKSAYRLANSSCEKNPGKWEEMPPLAFPPEFNRRLIEGWAVIGHDVAPWGATGNVKILAASPAHRFGEQASEIIKRARQATSASGATGCVQLIKFMVTDGAPRETE